MEKRFFLRPDGQPEKLQTGEHDHADTGRRILAAKGIVPRDYADIYTQLFRLGYARVAELDELIYVENDGHPLSPEQSAHLEDDSLRTGKPVKLNDRYFVGTRRGGALGYADLPGGNA